MVEPTKRKLYPHLSAMTVKNQRQINRIGDTSKEQQSQLGSHQATSAKFLYSYSRAAPMIFKSVGSIDFDGDGTGQVSAFSCKDLLSHQIKLRMSLVFPYSMTSKHCPHCIEHTIGIVT